MARIHALLDGARRGHSGALVLEGEAGIGKTALTRWAADEGSDFRVLSTVGIEGESDIPYAHLADVLRPLQRELADIPAPQAAALAGLLAIGPPQPADRFVVAAASMSVLGALAVKSPVLLIVDDCQFIDVASREALIFVARRIKAEGIAILFCVRANARSECRLERFPMLRVGPLDPESCRLLIRSLLDHAPAGVLERVLQSAGGNPLALIDLPSLLDSRRLQSWASGAEPIPVSSLLAEAFGKSILDLPDRSRRALTSLAVLGRLPSNVLVAALARIGLTLNDLEPAEEAGLIAFQHGHWTFQHPLIRSATYQSITGSDQRRAHLNAATVLDNSTVSNSLERRASHLISAGVATDGPVARMLDESGDRSLATQNFPSAARLFTLSAALAPGDPARVLLLIKAAHATRLAGAIHEARGLIDQAAALSDDTSDIGLLIDYLRCRLDIWGTDLVGGRDRLRRLASTSSPAPTPHTSFMLADTALASLEIGDMAQADSSSAAAVRLSGDPPDLQVLAVRVMVRALLGDTTQLSSLASRAAEIAAIDPVTFDESEQLLLVIGLAYLLAHDISESHQILDRAVQGARSRGAIGMLPYRLGRLAWPQFWRGDWAAAIASADEAIALASDTGWDGERASSLIALARVESLTGREAACRQHIAEAIRLSTSAASRSYEVMARAALGSLEFSLGNTEAALRNFMHVQQFADETGVVDTPLMWWSGELIECLAACDQVAAAVRLCDRLSMAAERLPCALAGVAARSRALLEPSDAEQLLSNALDLHRNAGLPFERARSELAYGRFLRRQRHRESRSVLGAALTTFERIGAVNWAEQCRVELRAAGARPADPVAGLEQLSPQELQVVLAVGRGLTNRQVAAHLYLSTKTVEYHLSKVYLKLGLQRRTQLVAWTARTAPSSPAP